MLSHDLLEALLILIESAPTADAVKVALSTMAKVVENTKDPEKVVLKTSNAGLQKRLLGLKGGEAALVAAGFLHDQEAGTLTWNGSLDAGVAAETAAAFGQALALFEAIVSAITVVGDSNTPAVAQEALKLCGTYVGNVATDPDAVEKRRIGANNKALNGRLLKAKGGQALLAASGFVAEPPEAFVCQLETPLVRIALVALGKASAIWSDLAASRGVVAGAEARSGSRGPKVTADAQSTPVEGIVLRSLPSRAGLLSTTAAADMQPALCKSDDGQSVLLFTWQEASHTWTLAGSMAIPSTEFVWSVPGVLIIQVDLGDAHGTGQPVELRATLNASGDGLENDFVTSRDFIEGHIADAYSKNQEPVLNANYLDEIARKLRDAAGPVMATIRNLKVAMEEQN